MVERMFDEESFGEEITNSDEAEACVNYFSHNESKFRYELECEGMEYDGIQLFVKQIWINLLESCKRVGYSDYSVEFKKRQYRYK